MALSQEIPQYPGFKLVWNDEFNVDGPPNPKDWIYELGFVRNQELQYYSKPNAFCKGGFLILEGRQERVKNEAYNPASPKTEWKKSREYAEFTSGSIKTASKHVWTYGRFECRGKFGITKGLWPAFWLTGPTREWPANGEIDVMEYYMHGYKANVAWGSAKKNVAIWRSTNLDIEKLATESGFANGQAWSEAFHTYRMDWDKDWIKLYVDGRLLNSVAVAETVNKSPDMKNPFHEPHHILLNLAIGATGGDPKFTKWPSQFVVDWVRVYQADEKGE
jgi:beta-glucanase (GH16 family)